jgi:hypothetical protein
MDYVQAVLLAGAIVTGQGALWRPVNIQQVHEQEPVVYRTVAGSVTNEYKKSPKLPQDCGKDYSLRCWTKDFE